jgi:uncharacterized protein
MALTRRKLLFGSAALAGAALPLHRVFRRPRGGRIGRFGPLLPDPNGVLDLPRGFSYRVVQRSGDTMSDGYVVPGSFDGMGCFEGARGTLVLMRNHENGWVPGTGPQKLGQPPPAEAYDADAHGCVTRAVLQGTSLAVVESNLVLAGTVRNCAGGPSPWGWLSCEETTDAGHGYVFLCRTDARRVAKPERIPAYGRYRHEAACVDPDTRVAYLTEDKDDACLYRFVPADRSTPFDGKLQALAATDRARLDTSTGLTVGDAFDVEWVDVDTPDSKDDDVRHQARARGAALVKRGEGIWLDRGRVFFSSTTGGPEEAGQIFELAIAGDGGKDRLSLLAQSTSTDELDMPDNLTVSPWGEIFLAEDSPFGDQYLRVLSPDGKVSDFARNAGSQSELAGVCFSPGGDTLFVNVYLDGLTIAIRGPFRSA